MTKGMKCVVRYYEGRTVTWVCYSKCPPIYLKSLDPDRVPMLPSEA